MPAPFIQGPFVRCPKSGKIVGFSPSYRWLGWAFPLIGLAALMWHLLRVVPKPSRALYPCQQVAGPLGWGFVAWLVSLPLALVAYREARKNLWRSRYILAALCFAISAVAAIFSLQSGTETAQAGQRTWTPTDPPNKPIGEAKGIFPGRVVWVRDASAVSWDGKNGHWWDAEATDQARVDAMFGQSIRNLAGAKDDAAAWAALFKASNEARGRKGGYAKGQKIVVKINQNTARNGHANNGNPQNENSINGNPHLILAMLRQLVNKAGVAQDDIIIYDISRFIPDNIFQPCHKEFPGVRFVETEKGGGEGREAVPREQDWEKDVITYSDPSRGLGRSLPPFLVGADYMINMAIMKNHGDTGPTLLAKNHFGTVYGLNHGAIAPKRMGESNPMVDLLAHKDVGGKTMLYIIDSLYGADGPDAAPRKWEMAPFGTKENPGWPASVFVSQDALAIESVGFDFVNTEWGCDPYTDNYLHEAALADNPPSGKKYAPVSLGVHEHWNNPQEKKYSRNLGTGKGIELVSLAYPSAPVAPVVVPASGKVTISWDAPEGVKTFTIKRAEKSGGPYKTIATTEKTEFVDTTVKNGTGYFYSISSSNALGESAGSDEVSARPGAFVAAINSGGKVAAQFSADANFSGGGTSDTRDPIDVKGVEAAAPQAVYQTARWGGDLAYTFENLKPGSAYTVRLHLAELNFSNPGQRVFNVLANGQPALENIDIVAITGGKNKALVKEFAAKAGEDGKLVVSFKGVKDIGTANGIEVLEANP
jgi:hypothetical protein